MKKKGNKEKYQKEREKIHIIPITALLGIDQDKDLICLETRRPDFGIKYQEKNIGVEVTEVRPHKYNNKKKLDLIAINKTLEDLIRTRLDKNKVNASRIDVIPNEDIYNDKIDKRDETLIREIDEHLIGKPRTNQYIDSIKVKPFMINGTSYTTPNNEIGIYIECGGGFVETIPQKIVFDAITKKEDLINMYVNENKNKFDELWLFITMPHEEHMYSFKGFKLPITFLSKYDRIYVGQLFPPFANCIYKKTSID